jgi:feruloyl esterase
MRTNDLSIDARRARLIALFAVAAAAAISTSGCGGGDDSPAPAPAPAPTALTCDDSMKTAFKPDANTTVVAVKAFKKGDPLALSGTPATPAPAAAANDLCMVKLNVGPAIPDRPAHRRHRLGSASKFGFRPQPTGTSVSTTLVGVGGKVGLTGIPR